MIKLFLLCLVVAYVFAKPKGSIKLADAATDAATGAATDAATGETTDAATDVATNAATNAATDVATNAATGAATDAATGEITDAATDAATDTAKDVAQKETDMAVEEARHANVRQKDCRSECRQEVDHQELMKDLDFDQSAYLLRRCYNACG